MSHRTSSPSRKRAAHLLPLLFSLISTQVDAQEALRERSRVIAQDFAVRLQTALTDSLGRGSPADAIAVCTEIAPQVASELSRRSGATVTRTSLRSRNPMNAPVSWQIDVLHDFARRAAAGDPLDELEYFDDSTGQARYMKAIPVGPVCLLCHGSTLSSEVRGSLLEHYPFDQATGYELGDIRGAFSVVWQSEPARYDNP